MLGCGKHFPGLGEGKLDSHHELPVIDKRLKELWIEDLLPYRMLRAQMPMVMISHAAYPRVTRDKTPASLSKVWITGILRKRIGYRNLIVSDDLEMGGVLSTAPVGRAAIEFVRAGGDLCLICHREEYIVEAYEELVTTAERDSEVRQTCCGSSAARARVQEKVREDAAGHEGAVRRYCGKAFAETVGIWRANPARYFGWYRQNKPLNKTV